MHMTVDLEAQVLTFPDGDVVPFTVDAGRRKALLLGQDEIAQTLQDVDRIDAFEQRDRQERPWIYEPPLNA